MSATRQLARFATTLRSDKLPTQVAEMARRCLLDWLGVAIAGSRQPLAPLLLQTFKQMGGNAQATVVGAGGLRTSAAQAAACNATFAHAIDYDDVHMPSGVHATAPVWAAAMAVATAIQIPVSTPFARTAAATTGAVAGVVSATTPSRSAPATGPTESAGIPSLRLKMSRPVIDPK
jgi:2-methylcitrate dehydratase PrpD